MSIKDKSDEYNRGFLHALDEAEHMLSIDVVHSISSFRFDPPDSDYQRGFLHAMESYYQSLGRV
ncbi:MAG: hypothetical protein ACPG45_10520 [Flavobacteriaceae bacterium]|jgi:hypothetical protein